MHFCYHIPSHILRLFYQTHISHQVHLTPLLKNLELYCQDIRMLNNVNEDNSYEDTKKSVNSCVMVYSKLICFSFFKVLIFKDD